MSLTPSRMIPLGTKAPDFNLPNVVSGKNLSLQELKLPKITVIMFICNHCPYVQHILPKLIEIAKQYTVQGVRFIAINSNDTQAYPEDAPGKMREMALKLNFPFPYLFDETQAIAKAYHAECTPDFFIFDNDSKCVYRGQFDGSSPGKNIPVTGQSFCEALDNLLAGKPVPEEQSPSIGCNIKWRK